VLYGSSTGPSSVHQRCVRAATSSGVPTTVVMSWGEEPDAGGELHAVGRPPGERVALDDRLEVVHGHHGEERDVHGVVEVVVADDDVGDVLRLDAELAQRAEDEVPVGHHAGVHDDDAAAVADQADRARDVRHADVALDEDVQPGAAREFGHAADASNGRRPGGAQTYRAARGRAAVDRGTTARRSSPGGGGQHGPVLRQPGLVRPPEERTPSARVPSAGVRADGDAFPGWRIVAVLALGQIVSWGVLYYAFPVALVTITDDTGWSETATTGAFTGGLVVSALAGIPVGRWLDRFGPRPVMTAGSVLAAAATAGVALSPGLGWFFVAWLVAGVAMAAVLYQPAVAALTRWYGPHRVRALTALTLVAGLASTVFAPLTSLLLEHLSWRDTYLVLAGVLVLVTVPLHATALDLPWAGTTSAADASLGDKADDADRVPAGDRAVREVLTSRPFWLLSGGLTLAAFGLYATSVTLLIPLLTERGMSASLAATTLGLLGAGQLLGRLGYAPLTSRTGPATRAVVIVAASAAAIGLLAAVPGPAWALIAVAVLVGAVRGAGTLLQATVVAEEWGQARYASLAGAFAAPVTAAGALAPFGGAALADLVGSRTGALIALAGLVALGAVFVAAAHRGSRPGGSAAVAGGGEQPVG
jgi:MFS family permease